MSFTPPPRRRIPGTALGPADFPIFKEFNALFNSLIVIDRLLLCQIMSLLLNFQLIFDGNDWEENSFSYITFFQIGNKT